MQQELARVNAQFEAKGQRRAALARRLRAWIGAKHEVREGGVAGHGRPWLISR